MQISFGGATIKRPGSYSVVDTANMTPVTLGAQRVLAFLGTPNTINTLATNAVSYFNNASEAATVIGESELLDCMRIAWGHGADLIAVSPVVPAIAEQPPADTDWQTAIDRMDVEFLDGIVAVTAQPAIHTKVDTHITSASTVKNRRERRGFYGHAVGQSVAAVTALQTSLATERGLMATPAVYVFDATTGAKVLKPSYYLASAYAGLWASQPPQEPITYKYVKFPGLEKTYKSDEIETLLSGHIAPTEYVRNKGYRIVQGVTLSASADLTQSELSVSTLKDVMSQEIRTYMEDKYVGKAGIKGIETTIYNDLVTLIGKFETAGYIAGYVPESVKVTKNGTAFALDWEGQPTLPINNFLITSHFTL